MNQVNTMHTDRILLGFSDYFLDNTSFEARHAASQLFLHGNADPLDVSYSRGFGGSFETRLNYFFNWFEHFFKKYTVPFKVDNKQVINTKHPLRGIKSLITLSDYTGHINNLVGVNSFFSPKHDDYMQTQKSLKSVSFNGVDTEFVNNSFTYLDNFKEDLVYFINLLRKEIDGVLLAPTATLTFSSNYEQLVSLIKRINNVKEWPALLVNKKELTALNLPNIIVDWKATYCSDLMTFKNELLPFLVSYIELLGFIHHVSQSLINKQINCLNIFEKLYHEQSV